MNRLLAIVCTMTVCWTNPIGATEVIGWDALIDQEAQNYDDPYLDLAYEQLEDVRTVAIETARIEQAHLTDAERSASTLKRDAARARLKNAGKDAEWLISQRWVVAERREKAATAANIQLDGQVITLGGFAIPAPPADDGTPIAYLVPLPGMCSHMPPPNPNQMVRVRLTSDWSPERIHEPVRVTGRLSVLSSEHVFSIVDGPVQMRASLAMEADKVIIFRGFSSKAPMVRGTPHAATK